MQQGTDVNIERLNYFFDFCQNNAVPVENSVIEFYEELEEELLELRSIQQKILKNMKKRITTGDPFIENDYELTNRFFNFEDYETLFKRNEQLQTKVLQQLRERI